MASEAVAAVNTYNQINQLIDSSMMAATTANKSVQSIQNIVRLNFYIIIPTFFQLFKIPIERNVGLLTDLLKFL